MKTKEKILAEGLKQFNTEGVEKITTRSIASQLGISQGNLHYHYPNKDKIMEALFEQFIHKIGQASKHKSEEMFTKEDVLLSMEENYAVMFEYRFLFKDNEVVWRRLPDLKNAMITLLAQKKLEIKVIIEEYTKQGIFRSDISQTQIDFLSEQFIFTISSWLTASEYLGRKEKEVAYFARFTFRQWLPYLTNEKMEEWEGFL